MTETAHADHAHQEHAHTGRPPARGWHRFTYPGWLRVVATINPLTYAVNASRTLSLALPVGTGVVSAVIAGAVLCSLGIVFAVAGFRRPL